MKYSVCIPMYNEESIIENTAKTLAAYLDKTYGEDYELIFYDDGSRDRSAELVKALGLPRVRVIEGGENHGKGRGVRVSVLASQGEYVMFTDADLAYGCDTIKKMFDSLEADESASLSIGSRNISADGYDGYTFTRKLASKAYIKVLNILGGLKCSDSQCGCKAFAGEKMRSVLDKCKIDGFAFDFEIILRAQKAGLKIIEVPVKIINHRQSKVHLVRDAFKMLGDIAKINKMIKKEK